MKNRKTTLLLLSFLVICGGVIAQAANFPSKPEKSIEGDTVFYRLTSTSLYDYFHKFYDNEFLPVFADSIYYNHLEAVNEQTGKGYYKIYKEEKLIFYYDIMDNKIEGIGIYFSPKNAKPNYFSMFKNGLMDGVFVDFFILDNVYSISKFKKGKFKKYLYFYEKSQKKLKKINKHTEGPFAPMRTFQFDKKE